MTDSQRFAEIARRLQQAGAVHGDYEKQVLNGAYDAQWADWYAQYLVTHDWNDLFIRPWTATQLAEALRQADREHHANAPDQPWSEFYATTFLR